jgi:hypothetical protein
LRVRSGLTPEAAQDSSMKSGSAFGLWCLSRDVRRLVDSNREKGVARMHAFRLKKADRYNAEAEEAISGRGTAEDRKMQSPCPVFLCGGGTRGLSAEDPLEFSSGRLYLIKQHRENRSGLL